MLMQMGMNLKRKQCNVKMDRTNLEYNFEATLSAQ